MNATASAPAPPVILKERKGPAYPSKSLFGGAILQPYSLPTEQTNLSSSGPTACDPEYRTADCPNGHERRVQCIGCRKYDCTECSDVNSGRRFMGGWRKIAKVRAVWGIFVFTFPEFLHEILTQQVLDRLRKQAWALIELLLARENGINLGWAKDAGLEGWTFGALEFTHPAGDLYQCRACPWREEGSDSAWRKADYHEKSNEAHKVVKTSGDRWKPHFNFLVPMLSSAGAKKLQFYWRDKSEFERVFSLFRRAWRRVLSREFGPIEGEVNVFYEFRAKKEHRLHALRYFSRVFPGWAHARLKARAFGYLSDRCVRAAAWAWDEPERLSTVTPGCCTVCGEKLVDSGPTNKQSALEIRAAARLERCRRREAG